MTAHRMPYAETPQERTKSILRVHAITDMIVGDEHLGRQVNLPVVIGTALSAQDHLLAIAEGFYVVANPDDYHGRDPAQYPLAWLLSSEERQELDRLAARHPASSEEQEFALRLYAFLLDGDHPRLPTDRTEDEVAEALWCASKQLAWRVEHGMPDWPHLRAAAVA